MTSSRRFFIDETNPGSGIDPEAQILIIHNPRGETPDESQLERALKNSSEKNEIWSCSIDGTSRLTSLWPLKYLPRTQLVYLEGRHLRDLSELQRLRVLKKLIVYIHESGARSLDVLPSLSIHELELYITADSDITNLAKCRKFAYLRLGGWPHRDFEAIQSVKSESLVLDGGRLQSFDHLNCDDLISVTVHDCRKIKSMSGLSVSNLSIHACSQLQLTEVSTVGGLRNLEVRSRQEFDSLEFVRGCKMLERLVITGTRKAGVADFDPIMQSTSIHEVWIDFASDNDISMIGDSCPQMVVTNGTIIYAGGKECDMSQWLHKRRL